jgi:hypothetical protein
MAGGGGGEDAASSSSALCAPMKAASEGAWQGDNPLRFSLPLIILQVCLVLVLTRGLAFALRPLRQPRVIAEIIVSRYLYVPRRLTIFSLPRDYTYYFRANRITRW